MANIQVTYDQSPNHARSESTIAINPNDRQFIVAGSMRFTDPVKYLSTVATSYSIDGGQTWTPSKTLETPRWFLSDPALTWDDQGNVFLVALPSSGSTVVGIAVFKSTDNGQTWGEPRLIHASPGDDKPWAAADASGGPYSGRLYAVWDDGNDLRFARSLDHSVSWIGAGSDTSPTVLARDSFSPEVIVAPDGGIYVVWRTPDGKQIKFVASTDGGASFSAPALVASGIVALDNSLPKLDNWPVFDGATFRVLTFATGCVTRDKAFLVAWADFREGFSRIYCALSLDGGVSWITGTSGVPLLTDPISPYVHHFHPQAVCDASGTIGCAFYEFDTLRGPNALIDVRFAQSFDGGRSFSSIPAITDQPWDPSWDAPHFDGLRDVTFIGDYFGLDASSEGFYPLWTDTRTGIQELWTDIIMPNPRLVYGTVTKDGIFDSGIGYTVRKVKRGLYLISFDREFPTFPAAAATQLFGMHDTNQTGGDTRDNAVIVWTTVSRMLVLTGDNNGDSADRPFTFIVVGADPGSGQLTARKLGAVKKVRKIAPKAAKRVQERTRGGRRTRTGPAKRASPQG